MAGDFLIREYRSSDEKQIWALMEDFQDYLSQLDSMQLLQNEQDYGKKYTADTLKQLAKCKSRFLVGHPADNAEKVIGLAVGIISSDKDYYEVLGHKPTKEGRVTELFVSENYRGQGVGKKLILELDKFFLENGCTHVRLTVMKDNSEAHQAYLKMGFLDRNVEMLKKLN